MKCTRQRCQVALSTLDAAALMPSWLSLITSFTPRRPRRFRLRRNSVQNGSASLAPTLSPSTSRWPSVFTPTATITATLTMRPASRVFTYVASIHRYGQSPSNGPVEERTHALVELGAQAADLALGHTAHPERLDQVVHRPR